MLFQDDDFPIFGPVVAPLDAVRSSTRSGAQDLVGRVLWKINCRADAVDPELFAEMRDAGLYMVYMGLESGSEVEPRDAEQADHRGAEHRAVATLKELGILFDFGFMMLDPSSTFESIPTTSPSCGASSGDGSAAAEFCRMIPYDGTPIKDVLAAEGRLRGRRLQPRLRLPRPAARALLPGA